MDHVFTGEGKWLHKLFTVDEKYNYYGFDFYPDKASKKAFVKAGCQATIRKDKETGEDYVVLRRKPQILSRKGKLVEFGAPKVVDVAGNDVTKVPGNGSKVEVHVTTYDAGEKGLGTRLNKVVITEFVEYEAA